MITNHQVILLFIILATAFPLGYLLAWICRDELVNGRRYFKIIMRASVILVWVLALAWNNLAVTGTLAYIAIVSYISLAKSWDKKFVR